MKRYLVLLVTAALVLSILVVPAAVIASRKGAVAKTTAPTSTSKEKSKKTAPQAGGPISRQAVGFAVSPAIRDLPDATAVSKETTRKVGTADREKNEKNRDAIRKIDPSVKFEKDGALQQSLFKDSPTVLPTPSLVFDGMANSDNATLFGFRLSPPDTNGDVGPNHYVQVVNLTIRIFDKTGAPLIPAKKFSSIFSALTGPCATEDDGDPIALYDPMADRWLLSQFCLPNADPGPYYQVVAVSQTGDPTGAYNEYLYDVSTGNQEFPDYPHLSVWPDGYYMTTNQFFQGANFDGGGMFAFDRAKMLAGDPSASFIYFNRNLAGFPEGEGGMLPADMDGVNPPAVGTPCPFAYFVADEFGDPRDGVRIFDFHADFTTPANSTFTERAESSATPGGGVAVAAFNPNVPGGRDDVLQPSPASATTARLDSISDRLMHRLQYVNFGTYESLVMTHTVSVGTDTTLANYRSGIRYYQFRKNPGNNPYTVFEQGTYAGPANDTTFRWMGSAAVNAAGDLAVGYSASSSTVFPSIRYAARFAGDPAGSLAQGEQTLFTGTGVQTDTGSRWGDYSSLTVDPSDDCSFWYTQETYTAASQATSGVGWITKIGKFNLGSQCTAFQKGMISGTVTSCANGQPIAGATIRTTNGFVTTTAADGTYTLPKMAPGSYSVLASKGAGFSGGSPASVNVTNGGNTVQNFCLAPQVIITKGNQNIISAGANNALDPGETVTVALGVQNTGGAGACTTALTGTLQATGGVQTPSAPQNYGAVCAGDPATFKNFTFKVDPNAACGSSITATLKLNDGATNYPDAVYTFVLGVVGSSTNFSYTGPAVAIPDNAPAGVNVPITVSGLTGNTADVNFRIDGSACNSTAGSTTVGVDHTWVGDLVFKLTAPNGGPTITMISRPGGGTLGSSGNNFCNTLLDDDASGAPSIFSITSTGTPPLGPPYTGTFLPQAPLSGFDGFNPNGTWTLNVSDNAGTDTGSVRAFTLQISTFACQAVSAPRAAPFDFTGDGKADLSVFTPSTTNWRVQDVGSLGSAPSISNWGAAGDKLVPADYNGDLKADVAVYRPSDGNWYILNSGGAPAVTVINWGGAASDRPVPGDYDNDGKADVAVFRASEGNWYVKKSGGGSSVVGWGLSTDILVPGDYDGDGRTDYGVYRPSDGNWYILTNPASGPGSVILRNWGGLAGDKPVPADYDGDKKTDIAIYRASEFRYYIINSQTNTVSLKSWGVNGDVLVPADYDGDGKADIATYRPAGSAGQWWVIKSSDNTVLSNGTPGFPPTTGNTGDVPVPSAYIAAPNIP